MHNQYCIVVCRLGTLSLGNRLEYCVVWELCPLVLQSLSCVVWELSPLEIVLNICVIWELSPLEIVLNICVV